MTDRPAMFQPIMVDGILAGNKIMTRRTGAPWEKVEVGDRLWVRENHWRFGVWRDTTKMKLRPITRGKDKGKKQRVEVPSREFVPEVATLGNVFYGRTPPGRIGGSNDDAMGWHKRPSMFMPRDASRVTLIVTEVKRELLHAITRDDALAEGIVEDDGDMPNIFYLPGVSMSALKGKVGMYDDPIAVFGDLWRAINGPESWAANPIVTAVRFRAVKANIDSEEAKEAA